MSFETFVHLFAGGLGGTFGAVVTCPLEVVKTRLQSSSATFGHKTPIPSTTTSLLSREHNVTIPNLGTRNNILQHQAAKSQLSIIRCIQHIIHTEGMRALFKGLAPNIIGVAPSRAIYFCTYSQVKSSCNAKLTPDTPYVHMISAASAGFVSCTFTNPIWFIKTRMQLDERKNSTTAWDCIKSIYKANGILGFYKGITASYFGISETIIHFVIYEFIKSKLFEINQSKSASSTLTTTTTSTTTTTTTTTIATTNSSSSDSSEQIVQNGSVEPKLNFIQYMAAAATSKSFASIIAYPHEVARTRLREEGHKYRSFFQTIFSVYNEEGLRRGLYRGLCTQLLRQIPNTAIMMGTYEVVVYFMKNLPIRTVEQF
ncbi:hypothetical protein RDWZM_007011 [Blomia tropicalis]|uniref:Uncharacterized protein n=1 Tax=Blomia tropicalis TaxID=40697 RepID=A0A9Q0RNW6_BLOTA|nr:hypothetical protein RDWZM_007011 [Blomia tropicalis]